MEEEFYASLKLVSGEEIICLMMVDDSNHEDPLLVLQDPVVVSLETKAHHTNVRVEPWLKTTSENFYFIRLSKVITMTELYDPEMILFYKEFLESKEEYEQESNNPSDKKNISRNMGFLGSVEETKKSLEDIYKLDSKDNKES
jgi:hypothetical protein